AGWPRRGTPRAPRSASIPRGSDARPPRRSRSPGDRPARSEPESSERPRTRCGPTRAAAAGARRRCRISPKSLRSFDSPIGRRYASLHDTEPAERLRGSPMKVTPIHSCLGARVDGVDLTRPLDETTFQAIFDAFQEYSVLVFPDQRFSDEQQMAFSRRFGPLEITINAIGQEDRLHPNMVDLSNVDPDHDDRLMDWTNRKMMYQSGNQLWHTDSSFKPVPAHSSALSGREVPTVGGETEFVTMRHAYAPLPEASRRGLHGRVVAHSILYSRSTTAKGLFDAGQEKGLPPVRQALIRVNPANGRASIYIGSHAWYVEGMHFDESRRLLDDLLAHTTRPECVYQHRWRQWDLVMWDNRCVLHRGRPWDAANHRRIMRRTTVAGDGPTAEPPYATRTPAWEGIIPSGVGV